MRQIEAALNFLSKWWAVVMIPTAALAYTLYSDWLNNREIYEVTGLEPLALYDLRSENGVEVPEFVTLLALEITNKSRKPIYISRADCSVDWRATRIVDPREALCAAFAGRPQDDYAGFVNDGLDNPTISSFGYRAARAPVELAAGGIGYVTLLFNHNPTPPFQENQQLRLAQFDTSRWSAEGVKKDTSFMHEVVMVRKLDTLYNSNQLNSLIGNEIESFLGAEVWLETTKGTRLDPVSIAAFVFTEDAAVSRGRSIYPFLNKYSDDSRN
ncbi:hypothetical protein [Ruegeria sp. Ofav3-42]|uniref:hypothetical protein n=1 Tax=Ruegeria sp. Ofav3-42 TaxID=2917759 RepID=UPI001EF42249|nr:hypothetical protein [Ruegeria sp. Ofav3-42]MCG7520553.1 hypothetical protein [Ruegeria sp. Ofav3-42]